MSENKTKQNKTKQNKTKHEQKDKRTRLGWSRML